MDTTTPYPTNLSDAQWDLLRPLLPCRSCARGRPRRHSLRTILNAIFYALRSGCAWRLLPRDLPPWQTVYHYFRQWRRDGTWERIHTVLRERLRLQLGRNAQPSAGSIDSQSVKTTGVGGPQRGFDSGKKVKGRKRHLLVDTQGLVLAATVHSAQIMDRDGVKLLLTPAVRARFPQLHVWLDSAYTGKDKGMDWIKKTLGWSVEMVKRPTKPRGVWLPKDTPPEQIDWSKYLPPPGFHVLPRRWVVERTFGWLSQNRRLSKDYERLCTTGAALIYLSMIRLMLRRLAPS